MSEPARIALVGSPNSGKTSLFNALTGLRHKVANYAGVTVEHVEGRCTTPAGEVVLVDLPGVYSLEPISPDERVTADVVAGRLSGQRAPDALLVIADSTALDRGLALAAEVARLGRPTALALTMVDELTARGGALDLPKLQRRLGLPVVGVVGNRGIGLDALREMLGNPVAWSRPSEALPPGDGTDAIAQRFAWAEHVASDCATRPRTVDARTEAIDRVLLHPVAGIAVFVAAMFLFFQAIFTIAAPLQDGLEGLVGALGALVANLMPDGLIERLFVDGIIAGVGSVVVFVPQIALLLVLIALFEASGYMARAAFLVDRVMGWAGLEGRSFVALLSSHACAIPGMMAARTVRDPRARLATVLAAPLMTCAARLPVYGLLIGAFVPRTTVVGPIGLQGLVLFALYALGALSGFVAALLVRRSRRQEVWPFTMQLPPYRAPTPRYVLDHVWRGVRGFLRRAGTVILVGSVAVWALLSFPRYELPFDERAQIEAAGGDPDAVERAREIDGSAAAALGRAVEPVFAPLGFDWRINVGVVASFAAREVIVATLSQTFAHTGGEEDLEGLGERLRTERRGDGPAFPVSTALALIVFYVYALQCLSTLAVMRRETGSWFWPATAWVALFGVAWGLAWLTRMAAIALGADG